MKPSTHTMVAIALLGAVLVGCGGSPSARTPAEATKAASITADDRRTATERGQVGAVTLYVSNQSFDDPSVELTIAIDGTVVVDQQFAVEAQHNWVEFDLPLSVGQHELVATSDSGLEETFTFATRKDEPRWLVVNYWWYSGQYEEETGFTFHDSDEPVGFA